MFPLQDLIEFDMKKLTQFFQIQMHNGAMYLGVDAWQVPNGFDIIGAIIYWLKEGSNGEVKLDSMPLDFFQLTQSLTGEYLAQMVQHIVEKFGLEKRVCNLFFHHLIVYQLTHTSFFNRSVESLPTMPPTTRWWWTNGRNFNGSDSKGSLSGYNSLLTFSIL